MIWYERHDKSTIKTTVTIVVRIAIVGTQHKAITTTYFRKLIVKHMIVQYQLQQGILESVLYGD